MSWWFNDWHCCSSILSLFQDISCIFFFYPFHPRERRRARRERAHLWGSSSFARLLGVWFKEYLFLCEFLLLVLSLFWRSCSFVWSSDFSLIGQVEEGAWVIDWSITTLRISSRKSIWLRKKNSSSFLRSYARSRYVSQVISFSFILCLSWPSLP